MQVKSPFGKTQAALKEPSGDYDQVTKKYVDESIVDHRNDTSVHLTLAQNVWLSGINATQAEVNYLSGVTSSIQGQLNTKLGLAGGTLTGPLVLSANPTLNLGAATKQYVDTADAASKDRANHTGTQPISSVTDLQNQLNLAKGLGTGLSTQDPNLATEHVILSNHANTPNASFYWHITTTFWTTIDSNSNRGQIAVQYNGGASVYARSSYSGVWTAWERLDNAGVSASQISTGTLPDGRLSGTYTSASIGGNAATATKLQTARAINGVNFDGSSNITVADSTKLPLAGGTLTGMLTLSASPTLALHAATKGYVDSAITSIPSSSLTGIIADARLSGTYTNASVGGNAGTATKLQTGRTINGVNFDGSSNITVADSTKLPTTGGVMTGFLTLHADPTANMQAATKKYVDDTMVGISYSVATTTTDGLMSSIDKVKLNGIATSATANQTDAYLTNRANHTGTQAISTVSGLQTALDGKLPLAGGTLTGMLTLSANPTASLHAATKQYVDNGLALKAPLTGGGTSGTWPISVSGSAAMASGITVPDTRAVDDTPSGITGYRITSAFKNSTAVNNPPVTSSQSLYSHIINVAGYDTSGGSGGWPTQLSVGPTGIAVRSGTSATTWGAWLKLSTTTDLNTKLNLSGGTLTNFLTLHADPTSPLHAATKQYVDNAVGLEVSKAGDTMTGFLTLHADPTSGLHAATKQYVDTAVTGVNYSLATPSTDGLMSAADKTKINTIATGATVNSTDAVLKDRANHTGVQAISTITNLQTELNNAKGLAGGALTQDPNDAIFNVILTNHANTPNPAYYWHITTTFYSAINSTANRGQIAVQYNGGGGFAVYARSSYSNVWTAWVRLDNEGIDASKLTSGIIPDARLSGTYTGVNVTGNAATATTLQTARTINGVSFNGSANITISDTTKLPLAGGTLTGLLTLSGAPTVALHAATKQYVDDGLALKAPLTGAGTSGTWPIAITGNAATATTATVTVAPTLTGPLSGYSLSDANTGSATNGVVFRYLTSGATNKPTGTDHALMSMNYSATFAGQMAADWRTNNWYVRTLNNGSWTQWETVYTSGNLTKATLGLGSVENTADNAKNVLSATKLTTARTIGGVSFDGTANINLPGVNAAGTQATSGNAATATVLQTARTINGTSFNGSANITTALWGTPVTMTIGSTGKSVNGSVNVSWSLAEIGAAPLASPAFTGVPTAPTAAVATNTTQLATTAFVQAVNAADTGSAATALALKTARTINGVSFNGSANITISDDTKLPTTGGSMSGPVSFNGEYARGNITGAVTIDFTNGQKANATLTGNSTITFTFPGVGNYQLRLVQDATGNRTVSYANTPKYVGSATAPDINTAPNTETILSLFWSGSAIYLAGSKVNA